MPRPFTADDAWAFNAGSHTSAYEVLGAHIEDGAVTFRVWAPNARSVSVIGDMNDWSATADAALKPDPSGVWRGKVEGSVGQRYKYRIVPKHGDPIDKADPFAFATEEPPATSSVIWNLAYEWSDVRWMKSRGERSALEAPMSIYEVHLGSWRYEPGGYTAIARQLAAYAVDMGFTHIEVLPWTEHPYYGSWGYQTLSYFAPTARYGTPQQLMELVDILHENGLGVILDWVPSHFPDDAHGLVLFDGTELFSHADPRSGRHPDWDSQIFNYDRAEVRSFLLSSAHYWLDRFHVDGLRVDAVASMLYRDYSRAEGEWIPNEFGGRENLGAVSFLQALNQTVYDRHPGVQVIAEESTAWPGVSRPVDQGGLGFGYKWDMGWMHDTLQYFERDPVHRPFHHNELTFRSVYAFTENFILPLSHDEVVHGKGSLLSRLPGDRWQQFANLRLLL
ncbi:MAG: 1,4-alpha-glucan branching protein GlgB, partial [Planctomycetota bacterium]